MASPSRLRPLAATTASTMIRSLEGEDTTYQPRCVLLTGGAGFIGSHVTIRLVQRYPAVRFVVLDKLDYCSSLRNLDTVKDAPNFKVRGREVYVEHHQCSLFESFHDVLRMKK
jgi:dTDP-D-glucose 4,6-dehydratase